MRQYRRSLILPFSQAGPASGFPGLCCPCSSGLCHLRFSGDFRRSEQGKYEMLLSHLNFVAFASYLFEYAGKRGVFAQEEFQTSAISSSGPGSKPVLPASRCPVQLRFYTCPSDSAVAGFPAPSSGSPFLS